MSNHDVLKVVLHTLAEEAVGCAKTDPRGIGAYRTRVAGNDPGADALFTSLTGFGPALSAIGSVPGSKENYSEYELEQLALLFVYAFLRFLAGPDFSEDAFETAWASLSDELAAPSWKHVSVANLCNFESRSPLLDFGNNVTIRHRDLTYLRGLVGVDTVDAIEQDWQSCGRPSAYVIMAEHVRPKRPEEARFMDQLNLQLKTDRLMLALRLSAGGDVRTGRTFFARPAFLPRQLSLVSFCGDASWNPGRSYRVEDADMPKVRELCALIQRFEGPTAEAWKNVGVAIRSFTAIYDRRYGQKEDRIVDAVTAVEALVGADTEIAFRVANRVAWLLGNDDDDREKIYEAMKRFYDARSKIVHGVPLKPKQQSVLNDDSALMELVRRLLVAFIRLACSGAYGRQTLSDTIDVRLVHGVKREHLRKHMGLVASAGA